ncbi:hypothetical protein PTTG_29398 [Puccinia triticina 1-1 BBBD Race 1]|uniref:Retrotransposon Copia-like N-terminal domain-containing protein n=1 Tax=Puccinia triticina (isolate 1-1 / race 1 (BBBD)) TaxID=630390 RepID=A0A180G4M7_PUCT1|nr:hypothetical protein PTTG_29398 [Puccinia triticina 1-1 BBBD Race 1]
MSNDTKENPPTHTSVALQPSTSASTAKISTARLPILKAPGADSNFLNWKKVVLRVFKSAKVNHVLTPVAANLRPHTWEEDNDLVCAVLVQIVDEANLRHLADEDNAAKIWDDLSRAHQDSSTGGRVYWIRKLVNARMEGSDINSHIETLANYYERLNSLVTAEKPLTPDDVHNAALLSLIPPDWLHSLKNEAIRRESQGDIISVSSTKANSSRPPPSSNTSKATKGDSSKKPRRCPLCNSDSHDLNSCNNTRRLIADHKAAQKARWEAKDGKSDYSGSEIEVTAGNAVVSLSIPSDLQRGGDINIDSGCSMSMTPDISQVDHPRPDSTPVRLADHSAVEASHKGLLRLPIAGDKMVKSLVVPALHEPLLSVAALCDAGLTVVFTRNSKESRYFTCLARSYAAGSALGS